jgi:voltage-gated potassium channel Kch
MSDLGYVTRQLSITYESLARHNLSLRVQFHHYIYFSLVSLTTVGYGEIIPDTVLGKFMIVLMVVIILVVVPEQTNEIISLSNAQTIYERRNYISSPDIPYVVILGDIDLESLKGFCKEYFHKDHGERYRHIVILRNKFPCENIEKFLNKKNNSKFIIYLQGDPMNKEDLLRADILNAKSCIIFTNKNSLKKYNGDQQALLLAIFIKKFYYHNTLENYFKENKFIPNNKKELKKKINIIFINLYLYYKLILKFYFY